MLEMQASKGSQIEMLILFKIKIILRSSQIMLQQWRPLLPVCFLTNDNPPSPPQL